MASAAKQHAAQEKVAETLARQTEGLLAEPRAMQTPQARPRDQQQGLCLQPPTGVVPAQNPNHHQQQPQQPQHQQQQPQPQSQPQQQQQQQQPAGQPGQGVRETGAKPRSGQEKTAGAKNGGGTGKGSVGGESDLGGDDDPNKNPEARKARKKIRRACDYCT
ncbi:unnamed protein product [Ectocarpus sp. 12 AP-2014]